MTVRQKKALEILLPLLVGLCIFAFNISYSSGPAYLQDEIGYLSKAALLVGKVVDGSSSYHGGVSILISPVFLLDDPARIWMGILALNAIVCAISIFLLIRIIDFYVPATHPRLIRSAIFLSIIYPANWIMAGYIFPSIYLGFFFLFVVWTILQGEGRIGWHILSALLVGFIYWLHPTGLVISMAFMLARVVLHLNGGGKSTRESLVLQLVLVVLMVVFYKSLIHPYMNLLMTPEGQSIESHYGSFSEQIEKVTSLTGLLGLLRAVLGQLSYLIISTLGLGFLGLIYLSVNSWSLINRKEVSEKQSASFFILLSVLGLLAMGGVAMAVPHRIDHLVYGRYQEFSYALLLCMGFVYYEKIHNVEGFSRALKFSVTLIFSIVIAGVWLIYPNVEVVDKTNNIVNTIGMYPQYIFEEPDLVLWLAVGLCGVLFLFFMGPWFYIPVVLCFSVIAIFGQVAWHRSILEGHSKPSALVPLIADTLKSGDCVAFDGDDMHGGKISLRQREQFNVFKFHFSNYQYKRMSFASWFNDCDGPLLTYSPEKYIGNKNIIVRARDADLSLFLISRSQDFNWVSDNIPGLIFNKDNNSTCFIGGCFEMLSNQLLKFSQNGMMRDGYLVENVDKTGGYIFFGPYSMLGDGAWRVNLELERFTEGEYVLDVVSGGGKVKHAEKNINPGDFSNGVISLSFDLVEKVNTLEIRLRVAKAGNISVKKYTITSR